MTCRKPGRRNGRPPLDDAGASTRVSVRLTASTYDELYALASMQGVDVSTMIRTAIERQIVTDRRAMPRPN